MTMKSKLFSLLCLSTLMLVLFVGVVSADLAITSSKNILSQDSGEFTITISGGANTATATATIDSSGSVDSITITHGGNGYTSAPSVTIDGTTGTLAAVTATIDSSGSVDSINITNGGDDYTAPIVTINAPTQTNVIINIDNLHEGIEFIPTPISLTLDNQGVNSTIITYSVPTDFDFNFETEYSVTISVNEETVNTNNDTLTLEFEKDFCENCERLGDLDLYIDDVYVREGFGDDDEYWYPFDEIEVDLVIESDSYDIEDIEIEWALYTESGDKITDDTETDFNLDEDEEKEITISFRLDDKLSKLEGEDNLIFYVKATGVIDDNDYEDGEKTDTCASDSQEVSLITDDTFVIVDSVEISETVQCGTELQITADVWNIGDDDQDDVYVTIYNHELGINEQIEIGDLDAFDSEKLDALIKIPENAEEKWYTLTVWVYDDDNDIYENSEDELAEFEVFIKVEGNCIESIVSVYATKESGGKAGQELTVKAIITNLGNELVTYNLEVSGEDDWASSADLGQSTILLDAGQSKEVLITFDVNADALGEQLFNIEVLEGNELILTQPVSVSIEKAGFNFPGITGNVISKDNWYLWGIGALNVILVLIIISIAVRVMKK